MRWWVGGGGGGGVVSTVVQAPARGLLDVENLEIVESWTLGQCDFSFSS